MRLIKIFLCLLPVFLLANFIANDMKNNTVLICYGKLKAETIKGYGYVILESRNFLPSNIRVIKSQNEKVFAYISLGEVNENAPHYQQLKGSTLGKNNIWNSYYLDLRSPKTNAVLMEIVDGIFAKGYDGLFLDNIDNFTIHGPQKSQKAELLALLKQIKDKYPKKQFIQNAGLDLASETAPLVDAIAIESIATAYDFNKKKYQLREKTQFESLMDRVKSVNESTKIPVILIEYSDSVKLTSQVLERIENTGFDHFIGNIDLQTLPKFKE
jgi:hypothetical protein